jgi:hypothetical protein
MGPIYAQIISVEEIRIRFIFQSTDSSIPFEVILGLEFPKNEIFFYNFINHNCTNKTTGDFYGKYKSGVKNTDQCLDSCC